MQPFSSVESSIASQNDAVRVSADPTFRLIGSPKRWDRGAALTSTLHWFETELLTQEQDGFYYIPYVIDLAHIYTILGEDDLALDQIEHLLTNPSWITPAFLEMDPRWAPLRDVPRYQALIEKHATQP